MLARVVAVTGRGPATPLSVFVTASDHGSGSFSPLSARGMGGAAGEPGVRCGRVWWLLSVVQLPVVSEMLLQYLLSVGSAASPFPPVVTRSGHRVG